MISELLLNIETNKSGKSFLIKDMSIYNSMLPITCGQLTVKVPGFTNAHTFEPLPDFEVKVNLGNLGIQNVNSPNHLQVLPDGAYEIRYSINPNDQLYVDYIYFNTYKIYKLYIEQVCKFLSTKCDMSLKQKQKRIEDLWEISYNISLAKIAAEDCHDLENAQMIYTNTLNLLQKLC
jgi:hypothetical protein